MNYLESYRNCTTCDELLEKIIVDYLVNNTPEERKAIKEATPVVLNEKKWEDEFIKNAKEWLFHV